MLSVLNIPKFTYNIILTNYILQVFYYRQRVWEFEKKYCVAIYFIPIFLTTIILKMNLKVCNSCHITLYYTLLVNAMSKYHIVQYELYRYIRLRDQKRENLVHN